MTASKFLVVPILTCILLLIDCYVWQAVKVAVNDQRKQIQQMVTVLFWSVSTVLLLGLWAYNFIASDVLGVGIRTVILSGLFVTYGGKMLSAVLILAGDASRLVRWSVKRTTGGSGQVINRSEFLMKAAVMAAAIPAGTLTWGIVSGAHDYHVHRVRLVIKGLPKAFEGMTIAQISDIHTGSLFNRTAVKGGVERLLETKPDMVFFTGDLVNDRAGEVRDYIDIFNQVKAPLGVFSTLGNHDYGAYLRFPNPEARLQNLKDIKHAHRLLGYDLLVDENRLITLGGESLAIIGVENCSANESIFRDNGNLSGAIRGTDEAAVKLLLSHDPTHWDKEVNTNFPDIDVMFSGHTHGTQFGISVGDKSYSPAQWSYKQWAGLYRQGEQQLYVNRGFGYLGYPGRVGMPPEITLFELAG